VGAGDELPDLVPTSIGLTNPIPSCPPTEIYFCIENRGGVPARAFQVLLHVVGGESLARFFPEVEAGEHACVGIESVGELGGIVPEEGGGQLEVIVDARDEVPESDEGNNRSVFDIPELPPPSGCPTPTPTPSANLRIDPPTYSLPCAGSFDASIVAEG